MKVWVAALALLFSAVVSAANIAFLPNKGGGYIVLSDEACTSKPNYKFAFSTHPESRTIFGCWTSDANFIHIHWTASDEVRSYLITDFIMAKPKGTGT